MAQALPAQGVLRVVPPGALTAALQKQAEEKASAEDAARAGPTAELTGLASYIRTQYEMMRQHRSNAQSGWSERLLAALRAFNGQYEATKLAEIKKFGGSEVYARVIAMKCRGASSLLRDVYLGQDKAWGIAPEADPDVPPDVQAKIQSLVFAEVNSAAGLGQQFDPGAVRDRTLQLMQAAREAAKHKATQRARIAEDKIEELLQEGGFYKALAEFLVDLPLFPFACIKGPVVRIIPSVTWTNGQAAVSQKPRLFWERVSPFDLFWTPGVADVESASVIERTRLTRGDLNDLLDLPGYDQDAVRAVLQEYGSGGLFDNWDQTDSERAVQESRENPQFNRSGLISCLEFHGNVQGLMLLQQGMDPSLIEDPLRDYMVQAWLIGRHVLKVQLSPSPRKRHPYYITSFEKVPGTPVGNALPDLLADVADVCNSTLRALVNNMSMASGPQATVNVERLAPGENPEEMYPWKRWQVTSDPLGNNTQEPVSFFQPQSNANELLAVYGRFNDLADELSAIPKYLSGNSPGGGAGRTASGLAMLMGNASKILQTVAANVDRDVLNPSLTGLFDMIMLTDQSGLLTGSEEIRVLGVNVAVQRETQRARQLEFLQITANPIDTQIMGPKGRAAVLRSVSKTIGIDSEQVVPDESAFEAQPGAPAPGSPAPAPAPGIPPDAAAAAQGSQQSPDVTQDMGPRTRITGGAG